MIVNTGGVRCQVGGAVVGEVTGVRVTLFGMSECVEELFYNIRSRGVCLVCVRGIVDGSVAVLELPIADVGR